MYLFIDLYIYVFFYCFQLCIVSNFPYCLPPLTVFLSFFPFPYFLFLFVKSKQRLIAIIVTFLLLYYLTLSACGLLSYCCCCRRCYLFIYLFIYLYYHCMIVRYDTFVLFMYLVRVYIFLVNLLESIICFIYHFFTVC